MKLYKKTLSVVLAALVALSVTVISVNNSYAEGNESNGTCTVYYSGDYYNALGGLEGLLNRDDKSEILSDLGALIGYTSKTTVISNGNTVKGTDAKHPTYTGTSSNSLASIYKRSERLADDTHDGIRLFYTNDYITTSAWNREHVWPQSKSGGLYGKTGGGNDLHHIRPTYDNDNSCHGSYPYGYVEDGEPYYCNKNSNSYVIAYTAKDHTMEVVDDYKGDIARIYAYMVTHYPSLYNLIDKVMVGGYDTLVKWNEVDPVDDYEINRNEVAYDYQGNRNPFIDCPELINVVWGNSDIHDVIYDTDSDVIYYDTDTSVIISDTDNGYSLDYLTIEEANKESIGSIITVRGQVSYIYGGSTVILEEMDEFGNIHTFQVYDQAGVINGKYPINTIVQVTGELSDYSGVKQIKLPDKIVQISGHVSPIPAVECTIDDLEDNITKVVVLRNVVLGDYDYSSITLTDESGDEIQCFKPAEYPEGIESGDTVDVCCVAYIYKGEVQIRIANSYDYRVEYSPENDPSDDLITDTEDYLDDDTRNPDNGGKDISNKASLLGDTDCNGVLDMEDVVETQKYIAQLIDDIDDLGYINADIDGDGYITLEDVVGMQRMIAKLD